MKKLTLSLALVTLVGTLVGCSNNVAKTDKTTTETLLHYQCGNQPLDIRLNAPAQQVRVIIDGTDQLLHRVASTSGTQYSNAYYSFWYSADNAMILRGSTIILNDCKIIP
ncbi:MliC family protein [Budvicia diplopodorum]|uniref:MliC family protein n=1 Tax=Budvicia diplopodorum TaxID=1119056 RepID=UPI00135B5D4B|nr:MliC family protein [Budvicia diplopodorum]